MEKIVGRNFSNNTEYIANNIEFENCNFSQIDIFTSLNFTNCIFRSCNLTNVDTFALESNNEFIDCNLIQNLQEIIDETILRKTFYNRETREIIAVVEEEIDV